MSHLDPIFSFLKSSYHWVDYNGIFNYFLSVSFYFSYHNSNLETLASSTGKMLWLGWQLVTHFMYKLFVKLIISLHKIKGLMLLVSKYFPFPNHYTVFYYHLLHFFCPLFFQSLNIHIAYIFFLASVSNNHLHIFWFLSLYMNFFLFFHHPLLILKKSLARECVLFNKNSTIQ